MGSTEKAAQLRSWLRRKADIGLRTVGLVCDEQIEKTEDGIPVLGNSDDLEKIIVERGITQVIMLEFPLFTEINRQIISVCDHLGVRLLIVSDLEEKLRHPVTHFEDDGFRFIGLREEPLENPLNRFFKRAIDIAISLARDAVRLSDSHRRRLDRATPPIARTALSRSDARRDAKPAIQDL